MTTRIIVALYDQWSDAEAAVRDLEQDGFDRSTIEIVPHAGHTATSTDTYPSEKGGFLARLFEWNVPENDAHVYAEGVRRGGTLLRLRIDDDDVDRAVAVLERGNIVDVDERAEAYRSSGWTGYDETAAPYDEQSAAEERTRYSGTMVDRSARLGDAAESFRDVNSSDANTQRDVDVDREEVIPVAEERIDVGKRQVKGGVVRVRSYVTETPVDEQVNLRQERVTVERRPVDRAVGDAPEDAFREREIEVTETAEEAMVQKRAQVKEEVVIRKDVEERAQTVSDTVRRTEVEIDDDRTNTDRTTRRTDDPER
ncbi:MAG TPA: YsnF/AvaK domain-containing protein [Azospirillum sp.]|nr:YsnF/AvaK domain-containing protein [Azospirillum sp.]